MSITLLFLLVVVGSIIAYVMLRRGELLRFQTSAAPQEVINTTLSLVATRRRWATVGTTETSATFSYHRGPRPLVAIPLFLLFIIPGILYLVLAGKRESLSVTGSPQGGATTVQIASNGWRGKGAGRELRSQLGVAPGAATSQVLSGQEDAAALEAATSDPTTTGVSSPKRTA